MMVMADEWVAVTTFAGVEILGVPTAVDMVLATGTVVVTTVAVAVDLDDYSVRHGSGRDLHGRVLPASIRGRGRSRDRQRIGSSTFLASMAAGAGAPRSVVVMHLVTMERNRGIVIARRGVLKLKQRRETPARLQHRAQA